MGCSTRPYNLMPPKRRPSNRQAQAGGCRRPGGGDPTSKASPLAQDASISNGAEARAHHPLTPICPLELKGISKAERAGTACPPRKGWGMWHWERSLPASPTSFTRQAFLPSSLCSSGLVVSSGPFLHLLLHLPSRQSALEGMDVAADTLLLPQAQRLAGRLAWAPCANYQHKPQLQSLCPGVPFPISVPAWAGNGALRPRSSW